MSDELEKQNGFGAGWRNIAIVSAVFIAAFSVMLTTNYFQVRGVNPLQADVIETLKEINDANAGNVQLQEQIRQLDLLARKAYFIRIDHLMAGVYILLGALAVFIAALRFYYAGQRSVPGKQVAPVDEWMMKTHARRYLNWLAGGLTAAALVFALLSSPYMKMPQPAQALKEEAAPEEIAMSEETIMPEEAASQDSGSLHDAYLAVRHDEKQPPVAPVAPEQPPAPKVTHNSFRGNNANGVSSAKGIPVRWNLGTGENIAWKSDVPKPGFSSPVITGNRVFVTGADDEARELYCYDLNTGAQLWTLRASDIPGSPSQMPKTTDDTGLAAPTVATNGKQVCAIFASGDLICADMDGRRLWAKNLGVPQNHYGYASSLLAFGNLLFVQYDNSNTPRLLALDMATGAERWNRARQEKITWSSPGIAYVDHTPQLILMGNPAITAYNPHNGEPYWRVEGLSGEVASSPCSAAGVVFGASEYASLIAVDAATGETLWTANDYLPEVSSPVATGDHVFLATSYGVLACYDAKTGALKHAHELNTEFYSSPVIVDGKLYVFSNSGGMYVYSANSDFKLLHTFETGEKTFATPAFTDGRMVVRTENGLYCVAEKG
jgi:outer membrane protein assembly factor BamB